MANVTPDKCKSCKYSKKLYYNKFYTYCDYFMMTGKRRACEVGNCDKYKMRSVDNAKPI